MKPIPLFACCFLFLSLNLYGQKRSRVGQTAQIDTKVQLVPLDDQKNSTISYSEISSYDQPIVLFFWLSTCGPCKKEFNSINTMPKFRALQNKAKILMVSDDIPKRYESAKTIAKENNWDFNLYFDKDFHLRNSLLNQWFGVPQVMVIDKNKTIVLHKFGYRNGDENKLINQLKALLNK